MRTNHDDHLFASFCTSNMSSTIIEFEGFQLKPLVFIVKELAYYDVHRGHRGRWTFLPPYSWELLSKKHKKTFLWLTHHCHRLSWDSGDLPYTTLQTILKFLFSTYTHIYVKGLEKSQFLENQSGRTIVDLNDWNCPKIQKLNLLALHCPDHSPDHYHCALAKAGAYGTYIKEKIACVRHHSSERCQT